MIVWLTLTAGTAFLAMPAFWPYPCHGKHYFTREIINGAGPFFALLMPLILLALGWRVYFGQPSVILSRDGVNIRTHPAGLIPWAEIAGAKIGRRGWFRTLTVIRRPTAEMLFRGLDDGQPSSLNSLFRPRRLSNPEVASNGIDCTLDVLQSWIEEGRRNAATGGSPDPVFTPPREPTQ